MENEAVETQATSPSPAPASGWEAIPEDLRKTSELQRFEKSENRVSELAKSYVELSKLDSGKVKLPDDKTPIEEVEKFYNKLGRPEKVDGYKWTAPKDIPINEEIVKEFLPVAHKYGMTNKQVQAAIEFEAIKGKQLADAREAAIQKLNDDRWETYKKEWGDVKTKENIEISKRMFNKFAPKELKDIMTEDDVIKDPILVNMYANIGRGTLNDVLVQGTPVPTPTEYPPYPKSPGMYHNDPKWRSWFEAQGYDYGSGQWNKK
jgi:hypothetical protein